MMTNESEPKRSPKYNAKIFYIYGNVGNIDSRKWKDSPNIRNIYMGVERFYPAQAAKIILP
mgnify:FL=1